MEKSIIIFITTVFCLVFISCGSNGSPVASIETEKTIDYMTYNDYGFCNQVSFLFYCLQSEKQEKTRAYEYLGFNVGWIESVSIESGNYMILKLMTDIENPILVDNDFAEKHFLKDGKQFMVENVFISPNDFECNFETLQEIKIDFNDFIIPIDRNDISEKIKTLNGIIYLSTFDIYNCSFDGMVFFLELSGLHENMVNYYGE